MERYKPCILWNDINFPDYEKNERLYEVFAHFYSKGKNKNSEDRK